MAATPSNGKRAPKRIILTEKRVFIAAASRDPSGAPVAQELAALVQELIGRIADKWTMLILEVLAEQGELHFTQIGKAVGRISQKMLTQTLRAMERDGLVIRTVHRVVPPKVEYRLTDLGLSLGAAFCGVWAWAEGNLARVFAARAVFDAGKV